MSYAIRPGIEIEFDEEKWAKNVDKHKYGLNCLQDILDSMLFGRIFAVFSDEYEENGEPRFMVMSEYQGDVILAVCTWRNDGNTLRVISFRHANDSEEEDYYEEAANFLGVKTED